MDNYDIAFVSLVAKVLLFFVCTFVYYERKYITEFDNNIWKFLILFLVLVFSVFYNMDFDYYRFRNNFYQVTQRDDLEKIYLLLFSFFFVLSLTLSFLIQFILSYFLSIFTISLIFF